MRCFSLVAIFGLISLSGGVHAWAQHVADLPASLKTCVAAAPFVVAGRVVGTSGEPLSGVLVTADNQLLYNSNLQAVSDENGCYRIDLSRAAATWAMSAQLTRTYHGRTYRFDLDTDPAPFAGNTGAQRDFVWKLTGERPEGGRYGGHVLVYTPILSEVLVTDVELTLVPDGPIVDGSAGATLRGTPVSTGDGWAIEDVPVGRYTITARHVPTGQALGIRERNGEGYAPSVTLDFGAPYGSLPIYEIEVEVEEGVTTSAGHVPAPDRPALGAPMPNPASGAVVVPLALPAPQQVRMALFDSLGREVIVVCDGLLAGGENRLMLDTSSLPPGLYLVRVEAEAGVTSRPLVVAR